MAGIARVYPTTAAVYNGDLREPWQTRASLHIEDHGDGQGEVVGEHASLRRVHQISYRNAPPHSCTTVTMTAVLETVDWRLLTMVENWSLTHLVLYILGKGGQKRVGHLRSLTA